MADWETISRLCREALSRDTSDRSAFLQDACAGAPEVRRRVDELIGPGSDTFDWLLHALERRSERNSAAAEQPAELATPEERPIPGVLFESPFSILSARALGDVLAVMNFRE